MKTIKRENKVPKRVAAAYGGSAERNKPSGAERKTK